MPTSAADVRTRNAHLRVRDLTAGYDGVPVVRNASLCVGRGEIVTVIGPNGAGKSTLLKSVMGLLVPMSGEITLEGASLSDLRADEIARAGVGYVPQVGDVFDSLTVKENLEMGGYQLP